MPDLVFGGRDRANSQSVQMQRNIKGKKDSVGSTQDEVKDLANSKVEAVQPYPNPGFWSLLLFSWLDKLIKNSYAKNKQEQNLDGSDLWELREDMRAEAVSQRFQQLWNEEKEKEKPSVRKVLWQISKPFVITSFFIEWIRLLGSFAAPLILREMVLFIQDPEIDMQRGYLLALGMMLGALLVALGKSHSFYKALSAGLMVKAATNSAVYNKAIALSNKGKQSRTTGEIVNLMSTDAERLFMSFFSVNTIWSAPLQLAISLYLIHREVKDATWAGLGALFLIFVMLLGVFIRIAKLEAARMKQTDERVKLLNEMMQGIKVIKLMVWEEPILKAVDGFREKELRIIRSIAYTKAMLIALVLGSTLLAALATFGAFVGIYPDAGMDPVNVFTSLALLNMLKFPMMQIPSAISAWSQALVSVGRLQDLLMQEEREDLEVKDISAAGADGVVMAIEQGDFAWGAPPEEKQDKEDSAKRKDSQTAEGKSKSKAEGKASEPPSGAEMVPLEGTDSPARTSESGEGEAEKLTLQGVNVDVKRGELVMVVGKVGSGKSSLLAALMGEIEQKAGAVSRSGAMACVAQAPWIRNATLRDNVTFSEEFEREKFEEVLRVCCLDKDVQVLPQGADTEIGERGINLSGGQKARVQLARAVYRGADVYLLDDPLSAVDTHVARKLMDECITGKLRGSTVVLVTHQVQFLGAADRLIVMEGGKVVAQGAPEELIERFDFGSMVESHGAETEAAEEGAEESKERVEQDPLMEIGMVEVGAAGKKAIEEEEEERKGDDEKGKLVKDEERDKGAVSGRVYLTYLRAFGAWHHVLMAIVVFSLVVLASECTDFWLAVWSMSFNVKFAEDIPSGIRDLPVSSWLLVYAGLTVSSVIFTLSRGVYFQGRGVGAGRVLVHNMVARVLRGTMAFFDTTPSGRVLNRFSRDTDMVDTQVANLMENYLAIGGWLLGALVVICILLPWFCIPFIPIVVSYKLIEKYVTPAARELQRLDATARSPLTSHLSETLQGLPTIRTFRMETSFRKRAMEYLDQNLRPQMIGMEVRRWLDVRLELVNLMVQFFTAFFLVLARDSISPSFAGLALTKAMGVGAILSFMVMLKTQLETSMNAVERIYDYSNNVPVESETVAPQREEVAASWPSTGAISVQRYSMRYREGLPLVLKEVNLEIRGGERVGIVGRTGSGKSSFLVSLFRLVESAAGRICIDGVDIAAVDLKVLRSRLSIIPQDPVLFSGTLRFNLDPFDQHTDEQVAQVLEWVQLDIKADSTIAEAGENLSQGQRQLLALARVLLRQPKILMLDEATASVDSKTDDQIQETIQKRILDARNATMLTIAHRLNTIISSDRVVVMDKGNVGEFAAPKELLSDGASLFSQMVDRMGATAARALRDQCGASLAGSPTAQSRPE